MVGGVIVTLSLFAVALASYAMCRAASVNDAPPSARDED